MSNTIPKTLRAILLTLAVLLGLVAALVAAFVAFGAWANEHATAGAAHLCAQLHAGQPAQAAVDLGRNRASRQLAAPEGELRFFFQGWVFNGAVCLVTLQSGNVAKAVVEPLSD